MLVNTRYQAVLKRIKGPGVCDMATSIFCCSGLPLNSNLDFEYDSFHSAWGKKRGNWALG